MRKLAILAVAAVTLAGCASTTISKTPPSASTATQEAQPSSPASTSSLTGKVGTTFTVSSADGTSYEVTLDKVTQRATLGEYDSLTNSEDHAAAAEFTITGVTGQSSDDADNDANVIGSDKTEYQSSYDTLTVPNFNYGEFKVAAGQTEKGWVSYELPPGAKVAQVEWAPGLGSAAATWTISG